MKKCVLLPVLFLFIAYTLVAQDEEKKDKGFKKENLFTGGTVSFSFFNNSFLVGANPVFGYSIADWIDAGIAVNYTYSSSKDIYNTGYNDKLRQSIYGGGVFAKLYPVRFIFLQAQLEHNYIRQKYFLPGGGGPSEVAKVEANSLLVGGGYTSGREPGNGRPFFYLAILFDVADNVYSPYLNNQRRIIPIIRGGIQVPLFQGR
ncbi:MAG: hypothetical protein WDO16_21340 [Bacteroidota bacterium]